MSLMSVLAAIMSKLTGSGVEQALFTRPRVAVLVSFAARAPMGTLASWPVLNSSGVKAITAPKMESGLSIPKSMVMSELAPGVLSDRLTEPEGLKVIPAGGGGVGVGRPGDGGA